MLQDRTRFLAECDVLTGLANRSRFQAELSARHRGGDVGAGAHALLLIDLDGFKGRQRHPSATRRATPASPRSPTGSVRPAAPAPSLVLARRAHRRRRVLRSWSTPPPRRSSRRSAGASSPPRASRSGGAGSPTRSAPPSEIAVAGGPGVQRSGDLQADADLALYAAKAAGKNRVAHFHPGMRADGSARVKTIGEVAAAHERGAARARLPADRRSRGWAGARARRRCCGTVGRTGRSRAPRASRPRCAIPSSRAGSTTGCWTPRWSSRRRWRRRAFAWPPARASAVET